MSMCPVCNNPIDSQAPVCPHCGFKLLGSTQRFEPVSFGDDALPVAAAPQAAAALHDGGYVIRDANSFNGVWVNNESVETRRLVSGDVIQIGAFCLVYKEE